MTTAVVFSALAVVLLVPPPPGPRLRSALDKGARATMRTRRLSASGLWSSPTLAAVLAAFVVSRFVSGTLGLVLAAGTGVLVHRWVRSLESRHQRLRRERIEHDLPVTLDLCVSALAAGRAPGPALHLVSSAVGGPLAEDLATVTARLDLGADPLQVWRETAETPGLEPLGRAFARAARSGASVTTVLARCVDDLRAERRAAAQRNARAVGVRTAAPLGACFLPAFVVVGIVPTLLGAFEYLVL